MSHVCHLCGTEETRTILRGSKQVPFGHAVKYVYCKRCSFVSFAQDFDALRERGRVRALDGEPQSIDRYHGQEVEETNSVIESLRNAPAGGAFQSQLWHGGGRVLADIGCGAGGSLTAWARHGWKTVGVEPGGEGREAAEKLGLDIRVEPYTARTFEVGSLGMAYSYHALEHFLRPFQAVSSLATHLEIGGLLYIETPDALDAGWSQLGYDHWSLFSGTTLRGTLEVAGFEVVAMIDRHAYGTHGVAALARKQREPNLPGDTEFVPVGSITWRRDNYWVERLGLFHAFRGGRGRDLRTLRAPLKVGRSVAKVILRR